MRLGYGSILYLVVAMLGHVIALYSDIGNTTGLVASDTELSFEDDIVLSFGGGS